MKGKTVVITGATSGIGKAAALALHEMGAHVVLAIRNADKAKAMIDGLAKGRDRMSYVQVELSLQRSIADCADTLAARHDSVDVLINNAGIYPRVRERTDEGIEKTWATNVMGYLAMTELMLPLLRASGNGRVIDVASTMAGDLDLDDIQYDRGWFRGMLAYKRTKQANRMLAWVWDEKLVDEPITINVAHPGMVSTNIATNQRLLWGAIVRLAFRRKGMAPEQGADTVVWLASSPEVEGVSGKFWAKRRERGQKFKDMERCHQLWEACQKLRR